MKTEIQEILDLAIEQHNSGQLDEAISLYYSVLDKVNDQADAHRLLGIALLSRGKGDDRKNMFAHLEQAIQLRPNVAEYYNDLGTAYWVKRQFKRAQSAFEKSVQLKPGFIRAHYNLGNSLLIQRKFLEAATAYERCVNLDNNWYQAHYNLGNCYHYLGKREAALESFDYVITHKPDHHEAYVARSAVHLKIGNFKQGWDDYEHRIYDANFPATIDHDIPRWSGEELEDEKLLVISEQGIGDTIQFCRYLDILQESSGTILAIVDESLIKLLGPNFSKTLFFPKDQIEDVIARYNPDWQIHLMSLPYLYNTTLQTIPKTSPYLYVNTHGEFPQNNNEENLNVGLVWSGNPAQKDNVSRSCKLSDFRSLLDIRNVNFHSLQYQLSEDERLQLENLNISTSEIDQARNFADTAKIISGLDLVITVDTAVAHLAGAMGCETWVLLWKAHCWRYLENRQDSPWYDSMKLFRQSKTDEWQPVIDKVACELLKKTH